MDRPPRAPIRLLGESFKELTIRQRKIQIFLELANRAYELGSRFVRGGKLID